jgi:transcription initiation factor IIE alpha subunit
MMRANDKQTMSSNGDNPFFGVNFYDRIEREKESNSSELASEFGVSLNEIKRIKKRLERS